MLKASFFTLGCKLNQFETAFMANIFKDIGYEIVQFPNKADAYLINSCAVTAKSENHSRQAIRKAIRVNPDALIIATGCAAQINPEAFGAIKGVNLVLGNLEKTSLPYFLKGLKNGAAVKINVSNYKKAEKIPPSPMLIKGFFDYTRAFIKVQEGCDAQCAYCIVPKARGPARSIPIKEVLAQADILWGGGYKEIVLTGIHLGQYGRDMNPEKGLGDLLKMLLKNAGRNRLRLSSLESNEVNRDILDCFGSFDNLCPHFHIPLQSGSRKILWRMGRSYSPEEYKNVIHAIYKINPIVSIGADVMVGFPGETENDFEMTCKLVASLPLAYLHVFNFSKRPGTPAFLMPDQVEYNEKSKRSLILRKISERKKEAFRHSFINKELKSLILNQTDPASGFNIALTGNYIQVYVEAKKESLNRLALIRIERVEKTKAWGRIRSILAD